VTVTGAVTVTGTVAISGTVTVTGTVAISGTVTVTGTVAISGTVTITGAVTVTGTVSITGSVTITGAVTITSGAVTISTSGGTNIIVDKLLQSAYTENRQTVGNPTGRPTTGAAAGAVWGKFFPRGMRGFITTIYRYVKTTTTNAHTQTFVLKATPDGGVIKTCTESWASIVDGWYPLLGLSNFYWNYDSLFIGLVAGTANPVSMYDTTTPYDAYTSADDGVTWSTQDRRWYVDITSIGGTVGDIPISGTVNTVEIPTLSAQVVSGWLSVANNTETVIATVYGAGTLISILFRAVHDDSECRIYVDGTLIANWIPSQINGFGFGAYTIGVSLTKYAADAAENDIWITLPYKFRRSIEVRGFQQTGGAINMLAAINTNKL